MMKFIAITFVILCSFYMNAYINKIKEIEFYIYELYKSDFKEYLIFDDEGSLKYNMGKLKTYFESKGLCFNSYNEDLSFVISFDFLLKYHREYDFYLVKNNEV